LLRHLRHQTAAVASSPRRILTTFRQILCRVSDGITASRQRDKPHNRGVSESVTSRLSRLRKLLPVDQIEAGCDWVTTERRRMTNWRVEQSDRSVVLLARSRLLRHGEACLPGLACCRRTAHKPLENDLSKTVAQPAKEVF